MHVCSHDKYGAISGLVRRQQITMLPSNEPIKLQLTCDVGEKQLSM